MRPAGMSRKGEPGNPALVQGFVDRLACIGDVAPGALYCLACGEEKAKGKQKGKQSHGNSQTKTRLELKAKFCPRLG